MNSSIVFIIDYPVVDQDRSRKIYVYNGDVQPHLCSYLASLAGREWSGGGTAGADFGRVAYEVLIQRMRKQLGNNSETPDKFINKSSFISLGLVEHGRTKISETLHSNLGRAHLLRQLWRSLRVFLLLPFVGRTQTSLSLFGLQKIRCFPPAWSKAAFDLGL